MQQPSPLRRFLRAQAELAAALAFAAMILVELAAGALVIPSPLWVWFIAPAAAALGAYMAMRRI